MTEILPLSISATSQLYGSPLPFIITGWPHWLESNTVVGSNGNLPERILLKTYKQTPPTPPHNHTTTLSRTHTHTLIHSHTHSHTYTHTLIHTQGKVKARRLRTM